MARRPAAARRASSATTSAIGLWLLGVPFFYVLALISAVGELIPVVGPILSAIPAIAVAATVSLKKVLLVLIFFVLQQQFENHVLVPKVMSRQVGVSAVTVIVALLIGGKLLGIVGAILAVPTAAILQVVVVGAAATGRERARRRAELDHQLNRTGCRSRAATADRDDRTPPAARPTRWTDDRWSAMPKAPAATFAARQRGSLSHRRHQPADAADWLRSCTP